MNVTLPNGVTIKGVPENATKDQIRAKAISAGLAKEEDFQVPQERSMGQELLRTAGRGARYVAEGITGIPSLITQPIVDIANMTTDALGMERQFQPSQSQAVSDFLTNLGLPTDDNAADRVTGDVVRALSGGGSVLGTVQRLQGPIAKILSSAPGMQAVSETSAATAAGVARENDVGPLGQLAAGLFAGIAAPTAIQAGKSIGGQLADNAVDTIGQLFGKRTAGLVDEFAGTGINSASAKRLRSAQRLGERLTPAEALDDPILAAKQGASGTSEDGARQLVDFGKTRTEGQVERIGKLLDDISPDESTAAGAIRESAKKIIRDQQDALSKQAGPLYKIAHKTKLSAKTVKNLKSDPVLSAAAARVQKNPLYKKALDGAGPNDLKFWDIVKGEVDDQIETAVKSGGRNSSRLLTDSKRTLTSLLDEASPEYSAARAIYGEGAKPLQQLREGVVGRIADLEDSQLKNVSKILFDANQTDPSVLGQVRKQFIKENPDAWKRVIRNEIERRLDAVKADRTGSTFYNTILAKDRDFRMFLNASRGMPEVQKTLIDMRRVWGNLINPESVKGAAGKAKSSLDVPRSSAEAIATYVKNKLGGKADQAAVELITDPRWADEVRRVSSIKSQARRDEALLEAIVRVARASGVGATIESSVNLETSEVGEQ